jgi:hypothetical protein
VLHDREHYRHFNGEYERQLMKAVFSLVVALAWACPAPAQTNATLIAIANPDYWGRNYQLAVSGNYVFLSVGWNAEGTHWIFDISNPTNPVPVGPTAHLGEAITVNGNYAYLATGADAAIYNISDPTNAAFVGQITNAYRFALSGSYAYVVGGPNDLYVYDVSNPTNPMVIGHATGEPGPTASIAVGSGHAYIANGLDLSVYDVSNPSNPISVGPSGLAPGANGVFVSGSLAYVGVSSTNFGDWGTTIYDISTPTNPVKRGLIEGWDWVNGAASGNYYYASEYGLGIFDVSDPSSPFLVGGTGDGDDYYTSVVVRGNYAYASGNIHALHVYWLGVPAAPSFGVSRTGDGLVALSWPTPSAAFLVQQSAELYTPKWMTLTNAPVTIGSQNQVIIAPPQETMFYRLVSQ